MLVTNHFPSKVSTFSKRTCHADRKVLALIASRRILAKWARHQQHHRHHIAPDELALSVFRRMRKNAIGAAEPHGRFRGTQTVSMALY